MLTFVITGQHSKFRKLFLFFFFQSINFVCITFFGITIQVIQGDLLDIYIYVGNHKLVPGVLGFHINLSLKIIGFLDPIKFDQSFVQKFASFWLRLLELMCGGQQLLNPQKGLASYGVGDVSLCSSFSSENNFNINISLTPLAPLIQ